MPFLQEREHVARLVDLRDAILALYNEDSDIPLLEDVEKLMSKDWQLLQATQRPA